MIKKFQHVWQYQLRNSDHSFSIYLDQRLIAVIVRPTEGQWPVQAAINDKIYSFSKMKTDGQLIEITDPESNVTIATIRMPYISLMRSVAKLVLSSGEMFTWRAENFFALHWKWQKDKRVEVEVIDNLLQQSNTGIMALDQYNRTTDLLVVAGFFLSLARRSKLSLGMKGLKSKKLSIA